MLDSRLSLYLAEGRKEGEGNGKDGNDSWMDVREELVISTLRFRGLEVSSCGAAVVYPGIFYPWEKCAVRPHIGHLETGCKESHIDLGHQAKVFWGELEVPGG